MIQKKLKYIYLVYCLSIWSLGFLHLLTALIFSIPQGKILLNFNFFGELYLELALILIAIPGIYILLRELWEIIVVESY
jgi:hypothetical protein